MLDSQLTFSDPKIVEVDTTRPETLFADIALAVNPNDDRLRNLIGKRVIHPLTRKELPIVGHHRVKPDFGTGEYTTSLILEEVCRFTRK